MRARPAAWSCLVGALLIGCSSSSSSPPAISITGAPAGATTGPVLLAAAVTGSAATPGWALTGPGSLSGTSGTLVTYRPPPAPGTGQTAQVTASLAGGPSASVTLTLAPAQVPASKIAGMTADATVLYDEWEIPHVKCAVRDDCLAVQGYLHARDRLFQMDFLRRVARGNLATLIGSRGLAQDVQLRTLFTTRDGQRLEEVLAAAMDADTSSALGAYVLGVNARLAELRTAGGPALPAEYAQLPYPITAADVGDWTPRDVWALARLQQFQLSETLFAEQDYGKFALAYPSPAGKMSVWVRAEAPAGAQTYTTIPNRPTPAPAIAAGPAGDLAGWARSLEATYQQFAALRASLKPLGADFGSNNWVVDGAHSASGKAMVANDPHLSLQYPPNFYLATLTSARSSDNLDLTGGAFPGIPGAQVGRGKSVGWGVTVVGYDVTDLYLEQFLPQAACADPRPCVLFNGAPVSLVVAPQTYQLRIGPGAAGLVDAVTVAHALTAQQALVLVVPHHGPLVQAPDAAGKAVSVRWTGQEGWTQDLRAFLGLNTASGVDGAMAALDDYATGAQNFVLADDAGHIAYYPHALVPVRNFANPLVVGAAVKPPWFPLPGDGSAEWGSGVVADHCAGAGATVPAPACWETIPRIKDPAWGYLATANADPFGKSAGNNVFAHPPYLSFDWDDSTGFRHARIVTRLKALTTSGGNAVSLADMESIQADHVSTMGAAFAPFIAGVPDSAADAVNEHASLVAAKQLIAEWTTRGNDCPSGLMPGITDPHGPADPAPAVAADSAACTLFHLFVRTLLQNVFQDDLAVAGIGMGGVQAVKGMLYMLGTPTGDQTFCDDVDATGALRKAHGCGEQLVTALLTAYGTLAAGDPSGKWVWGRVHTFQPSSLLALVTNGYQPGPYARPGGAFTVDVASPSLSATGPSFAFGSSGNVRHVSVMDPGAPVVKMQLPGPERDVPAGILPGPDLLGHWARNEYFDFAHGGQIDAVAAATQTFTH